MYSCKISIDSGLIEKCIFINVREYSLFSSTPTNSRRGAICAVLVFCFKSHRVEILHDRALFRRRKYRRCSAPLFQMTDFFAAREIKKRKKLQREISEEKFHLNEILLAKFRLTGYWMREAAHIYIHKIISFSQCEDYIKYFKGNLLYTENIYKGTSLFYRIWLVI